MKYFFLTCILHTLSIPVVAQECDGWIRRYPVHSPGTLFLTDQDMAYDAVRSESLLFDGNPDEDIAGTWSWDGTDWLLRSEVGPESRGGHAIVYDSARALTILTGGTAADGQVDWVWEWDGQNWATSTEFTPTYRSRHAMAYDSSRDLVVLFGGANEENGGHLGDTWEWNGAAWTERKVDGPPPTSGPIMAYDASRQVTVLHMRAMFSPNQTWLWDGLTWVLAQEDQGPDTFGAMVYDSERRVCVTFGGSPDQTGQETWEWNGLAWTKVSTPIRPPATPSPAMAYDQARRAIVLYAFGGETWEYLCDPACPPDLDGNGALDLFDFLAFLNLFSDNDPKADCDGSGGLDLFDFLCFQNQFDKGC